MHKDIPELDAMLREIAGAENASLPFEDWKQALLQKAAEQESLLHFPEKKDQPDLIAGSSIEDELRRARQKKARRTLISLSGVAAALLVLLGVRALLPKGYQAAPQSEEAAPFIMQDAAADTGQLPAPAAGALGIEELPMDMESEISADVTAPPLAAPPLAAPPSEPAAETQRSLAVDADAAILAVIEALGMAESVDLLHAEALVGEGLGRRYLPLLEPDTELAAPDVEVYFITLDTRAADAPQYMVRCDTLEVLGIVIWP